MSYVTRPPRALARPRKARRTGLGSLLDDLGIGSLFDTGAQCTDQAWVAAKPLTDKIMTLTTDWHPTGLYTPAEVQAIVVQTMPVVTNADSMVQEARKLVPNDDPKTQSALNRLYQAGTDSLKFSQAVSDALANGNAYIQADDLKSWVIEAMTAAINAVVVASWMKCDMSWLTSKIVAVAPYVNAAVDAAIAIAGHVYDAIVDAGKTILKIPGYIEDVLTYGAIGLGAYLVYRAWKWKRSH